MIVVDTSAIAAILLQEPDAGHFASAIADDPEPVMSAASYVELNVVMFRRARERGSVRIRQFFDSSGIAVLPLTHAQAEMAAEAFRKYPALNFGDAFSYALAKDLNAPLLFKGSDFVQTDIVRA